MNVTCPKCELEYDDTYRDTGCPHNTFDMHCGVVVNGRRGCAHTLEEQAAASKPDATEPPNVDCPLNQMTEDLAQILELSNAPTQWPLTWERKESEDVDGPQMSYWLKDANGKLIGGITANKQKITIDGDFVFDAWNGNNNEWGLWAHIRKARRQTDHLKDGGLSLLTEEELRPTEEMIEDEAGSNNGWAWIRNKIAVSCPEFVKEPRTDSLKGTRYEVMGWMHQVCHYAVAGYRTYLDIGIEQQKRADDAEKRVQELEAELKARKAITDDILGKAYVEQSKVVEERDRLKEAIENHRRQKADDRCIEDDDRLYEVLGDGIKCDRRVGDKDAMLQNCARFIEKRCEGGGWPSYRELEMERDTLRAEIAAATEILDSYGSWTSSNLIEGEPSPVPLSSRIMQLAINLEGDTLRRMSARIKTRNEFIRLLESMCQGLVQKLYRQQEWASLAYDIRNRVLEGDCPKNPKGHAWIGVTHPPRCADCGVEQAEYELTFKIGMEVNYAALDRASEVFSKLFQTTLTIPTALLIGRWQVPGMHPGHVELFKKALELEGNVLIGVRNTYSPDDPKNPFTFAEIKAAIDKSLAEYRGRYAVVLLPNITNVVYGRDVGYKITQVELGAELEAISATAERAKATATAPDPRADELTPFRPEEVHRGPCDEGKENTFIDREYAGRLDKDQATRLLARALGTEVQSRGAKLIEEQGCNCLMLNHEATRRSNRFPADLTFVEAPEAHEAECAYRIKFTEPGKVELLDEQTCDDNSCFRTECKKCNPTGHLSPYGAYLMPLPIFLHTWTSGPIHYSEIPREQTLAETHWSEIKPCVHSRLHFDCMSCLQGHAARMETQVRKLEAECARLRTWRPDDAMVIAQQIVGTIFDNTAASSETLKRVMTERIADWLITHGDKTEPHWEVISDEDGVMHRVRWSKPCPKHGWLMVRHYEKKYFAEGDARRFNDEGKRPWEFQMGMCCEQFMGQREPDDPNKFRYIVIFRPDAEAPEINPFTNEADATVLYESRAISWTGVYLCLILRGPADEVAEPPFPFAALSQLKAAALDYLDAEREYHAAHLKSEAGPGICSRAQKAEIRLASLLGIDMLGQHIPDADRYDHERITDIVAGAQGDQSHVERMRASEFQGFEISGRQIITVNEGEITFSDDATPDDLRSAVLYLVSVIGRLTNQ